MMTIPFVTIDDLDEIWIENGEPIEDGEIILPEEEI